MSKKKRHPARKSAGPSPHPPAPKATPSQLLDELSEAHALMRRRRWDLAAEILERLDKRYPSRDEVLAPLVEVSYQRRDFPSYQSACERLLELRPDDPELTLTLA